MATDRGNPPFFQAIATMAWWKKGLYRIYVYPDDLLMIWAGSGSVVAGTPATKEGKEGLTSFLLSQNARSTSPRAKEDAHRQSLIDQLPLGRATPERLLGEHALNRRATLSGIQEIRITAPPGPSPGHQAVLHLNHRTLGKHRMGLVSAADARVALDELPGVLGDRLKVEVEWSDREGRYVAINGRPPIALP